VLLRRLAPGATYQPDQARLIAPLATPASGAGFAPVVTELLTQLVPPPDPIDERTADGAGPGATGPDADLSDLVATR
jgi:hypothetical protein